MISIVKYIYRAVRYSPFYPFYLKLFRNSVYREYQKEYFFYRNIIKDSDSVVFDIGANVGDKTELFSKFCKMVVSVDPDISNHQILSRRFSLSQRVRVVNCAVGAKAGMEMFYTNLPGSPANTLSLKWKSILSDPSINRWHKSLKFADAYEVEVTTLDELITKHGKPYFVKIDVEGYEKQVLEGLSVPIPVMCFEANFPDFLPETIKCIERITAISNRTSFNVIDDRMEFLWKDNKDCDFTVNWLKDTELRYFEIFCFS